MPNPKQPARPRSTDEILREMENVSKGIGSADPDESRKPGESAESQGGALKSLLNFFVKVVPDEEIPGTPRAAAPQQPHPQSPSPAPPPRVRVADLVAEEAAPKFKAPASQAGDLSNKSFDEIYKEAGLTGSPCSVDELSKLLDNPTVANQPLSVKIIAVNLTLSAKGIGPEVPIADAVRRDRALDGYQAMLSDRAHATETANAAKIQRLTAETEEYLKQKQMEMEALRSQTAEAKRQAADFSARRQVEEKRLAELISPFLEGKPNPVTVGDQAGAEEPNR